MVREGPERDGSKETDASTNASSVLASLSGCEKKRDEARSSSDIVM